MKLLFTAWALFCLHWVSAQTLCENGYAGTYPCKNVDLIKYMTPAQFGGGTTNEVWGWTDPLYNKEYVLLGKSNGTAFIDITNPLSPVHVGTLPPHAGNSIWRSLRTYNNYMFAVSEATGSGMQVFDLTRLRNVVNPPVTFTEDAWYGGFGRCHTIAICEQTGMAYGCGTQTFSGGLHMVNIQNPLAPVIAGGYGDNGYTHEAVVMVYQGPDPDYIGRTIAFCFNGNNPTRLVIVDVTDPTDVQTISVTAYSPGGYCHQGWLTADGMYMVMDDELDEYYGQVSQTRTLIWNMQNLDAPVYMGDFMGTTTAIDHNQMIVGNLDFQSNYTAGLRVLDITNIATLNLSEVAYFDHYTDNNAPTFDGTWMNYPFFASGVIPVGDIDNGLFLVKPNFMHLAASALTACTEGNASLGLTLDAGFQGPVTLSVSGLPPGISGSFSANNVLPPASVNLNLSALNASPGIAQVTITATGTHFTYQRTFTLSLTLATSWYPDLDGDGYGDGNPVLACIQPPGYANNDSDCNDLFANIYPGAPGTHMNVDNNCNGIIDPAEVFCPDLNNDQFVSVTDLLVFMTYFGCAGTCNGDFDTNGMVSTTDLLLFMSAYGTICP